MAQMTPLEQAAYASVSHQWNEPSSQWHNIIRMAEESAIKASLDFCHGNQTAAAELLGVSRNTFRERIGRYGLRGYGVVKDTC